MVIIDLLGAPSNLEGQIARRLIEIRPSLYVGSLSKRTLDILWCAIVDAAPQAAILVYPSKTEMGFSFKSVGECRYEITSNFGLPLVGFKSKINVGRKFGST